MQATFNIWKTNRKLYLKFLETYTLEQLNTTPKGFSNNLIWNIGHIIVAQQGLLYKPSQLPMHISEELFNTYKPGTIPSKNTTQEEVNHLKHLLIFLIEQTKTDLENQKFKSFTPYKTRTGFDLNTFEEAIQFNNYHEALHLGFMMNIRKFI